MSLVVGRRSLVDSRSSREDAMRAAIHAVVLAIVSTLALRAQPADQTTLPAEMRASIDAAVTETLAKTGAPSASIAVVRDGQIAYTHAYGSARLEPRLAATTAMRYSI